MTCPCCTSTKPQPGAHELYRLCDDCLHHAVRYAMCPHEWRPDAPVVAA